jgi:SPP1 family predicted phage head-tail adaptor
MNAAPSIGARRHYVTLEAPIDTSDDNGGATRIYAPVATFWARVVPRAAAMIDRADQQQQQVSYDIYFRARPDLTAAMRLTLGARRFQILAFNEVDERGATMRALCEEVKP